MGEGEKPPGYCYQKNIGVDPKTDDEYHGVALYFAQTSHDLGSAVGTAPHYACVASDAAVAHTSIACIAFVSGTGALARCYFNAVGVTKSPQRAVELYKQAVAKDPPCPIAMSALVRRVYALVMMDACW